MQEQQKTIIIIDFSEAEEVCRTLSLEGVQVMPEGLSWLPLLQDAQVAEFLHLRLLRLPLPHGDHHLNTHQHTLTPNCVHAS